MCQSPFPSGNGGKNGGGGNGDNGGDGDDDGGGVKVAPQPRRFYGSVKLDPVRLGRDAGRIAEEVLSHLTGLPGADAEIALELQVAISDGIPDHVVRTVLENCRTLKFTTQGFEQD